MILETRWAICFGDKPSEVWVKTCSMASRTCPGAFLVRMLGCVMCRTIDV